MHSGNISVIVSLLLGLRPSRNALPPSDLWTPLKRLLKPHFNSSLSWYQVCKLYLLIRVYFQCYVECSALLEFDTSNLMFTLSLTSNVFFYPPPDDSDESRFVPQTRGKGKTQMQTPINEQVQLYYIYILYLWSTNTGGEAGRGQNKSKKGHYDTKALAVPKIHLLTRFMPCRGWTLLNWNIPITFSLVLLTWRTLQFNKHLKMTESSVRLPSFLHLGLPLILNQQPPTWFPPCRRIDLPKFVHMCKMKNRLPHSEIIHHSNCEAFFHCDELSVFVSLLPVNYLKLSGNHQEIIHQNRVASQTVTAVSFQFVRLFSSGWHSVRVTEVFEVRTSKPPKILCVT